MCVYVCGCGARIGSPRARECTVAVEMTTVSKSDLVHALSLTKRDIDNGQSINRQILNPRAAYDTLTLSVVRGIVVDGRR